MNKCSHLGDIWSRTNYALRLAQKAQLTFGFRDPRCRGVVEQIVELLDTDGVAFDFVIDKPASAKSITSHVESTASYGAVYFPTKARHAGENAEKWVAYSFDAQWRRDEKIPPGVDDILATLISKYPGYRFIRIGLPMTIDEIVATLARSKFLLSVDNGIAHVARSVGVPIYLIEHRLELERGFPAGSCVYTKVTTETMSPLFERVLA